MLRKVPLRLVRPVDRTPEPGYKEWHRPAWGNCAVCDQPGRIQRHHVVLEQHVRRAGGDPWDMRNALELGMYCRCHSLHHQAAERISLAKIPDDAREFAIELFGGGADGYLARYYAP